MKLHRKSPSYLTLETKAKSIKSLLNFNKV